MLSKAKVIKTPKGALVRVHWQDATGCNGEDGSMEEILRTHKKSDYYSFGLFIGVSDEDVIITNDKVVGEENYRGTLTFPIHWIKEIKVLLRRPTPCT